jgi:hypothetical protein
MPKCPTLTGCVDHGDCTVCCPDYPAHSRSNAVRLINRHSILSSTEYGIIEKFFCEDNLYYVKMIHLNNFPVYRFGMQQLLKYSSHSDQVLVYFWLYHRTTNFIIIATGTSADHFLSTNRFDFLIHESIRDALLTSSINCATSILIGFVVFSALGHMAKVSQKTLDQVIEDKGECNIFSMSCCLLDLYQVPNLSLLCIRIQLH